MRLLGGHRLSGNLFDEWPAKSPRTKGVPMAMGTPFDLGDEGAATAKNRIEGRSGVWRPGQAAADLFDHLFIDAGGEGLLTIPDQSGNLLVRPLSTAFCRYFTSIQFLCNLRMCHWIRGSN